MTFDIQVETCNAAFDDEQRGPELAAILRNLADTLEQSGDCRRFYASLFDCNGNLVGVAELNA